MSQSGDGQDGSGNGKPPRGGQFKHGQSGNPAGRPRKQPKVELALPSYRPTQTLLRAEAERMITVREGDHTYAITTTEGVMRALAKSAMKGGPMAQRTYLALQQAEDARLAAEQEKRFNLWKGYVDQKQAQIAQAQARGEDLPDWLPHPDDIKLDFTARQVRFEGPLDEQEAKACCLNRARLELYFELMHFCDETRHGMPSDERPIYGAFAFMFACLLPLLPPRLRHIDEQIADQILLRAMGPRKAWIAYLNEQLNALGLEGDAAKFRTRQIDLRDIGFKFVDGKLVPHRWPKRREPA